MKKLLILLPLLFACGAQKESFRIPKDAIVRVSLVNGDSALGYFEAYKQDVLWLSDRDGLKGFDKSDIWRIRWTYSERDTEGAKFIALMGVVILTDWEEEK
jgi:hypothetical protein